MLFVIVTGPTKERAEKIIRNADEHADGYEFRLDTFEKHSLIFVKEMMQLTQKPIIFTLRRQGHGGDFRGTEEERKLILNELLELHPAFLDLELDSDLKFAKDFSHKFPKTKIICSYHNFEETPSLEGVFQLMEEFPAKVYKLATMANSIIDSLDMMTFVKEKSEKGHKMIGLCMGKEGEITRILGPIFGNQFNFAISEPEMEVAPGQLTAEGLNKTYHYHKLSKSTSIYGLIGNPVEQSPSHITHNYVLSKLRMDGVYVKMPVRKEDLSSFMQKIKNFPFKGLSVTLPHKEEVGEYLQDMSSVASRIGAVNTIIYREDGTTLGDNTDASGALDVIERKMHVKGKKIVVIGAGGSARAIVFEALKRGGKVTVVNRTESRAKELAKNLGCKGFGMTFLEEIAHEGYDILINSTSVGMFPNINEIPINSEFIIPNRIVMDIILQPIETRLLSEAKKKGCTIFHGYEMFISQAVKQFNFWFGEKVSREKVQGYLEEAISYIRD